MGIFETVVAAVIATSICGLFIAAFREPKLYDKIAGPLAKWLFLLFIIYFAFVLGFFLGTTKPEMNQADTLPWYIDPAAAFGGMIFWPGILILPRIVRTWINLMRQE